MGMGTKSLQDAGKGVFLDLDGDLHGYNPFVIIHQADSYDSICILQ